MPTNSPSLKFHFYLSLILIFIHSTFLQAQDTNTKSSVWKVVTENNVVYLTGSIHLLKAENFPLPPKLEQAFEEAEIIVFETSLDSMETLQIQQYTLSQALYPEGKTLQTELSDSVLDLTAKTAANLGLDLTKLYGFKPWFVAVTMDVIKLQQMGFNPNFGIDKYFHKKAKEKGKKILGLEPVKFQLSLFTDLNNEDQEIFLMQSMKQFKEVEQFLDLILKSWQEGDLQGIENTLNKSFEDYPQMYEKFLVKRNQNWLQKIKTYLADQNDYMIIVGAGHLAGKDGLIKQLQLYGYEVEQN